MGGKDCLLSFAADHGRESRHPFLDEDFVETILDLPLSLVADLEKPGELFILAHLFYVGPARPMTIPGNQDFLVQSLRKSLARHSILHINLEQHLTCFLLQVWLGHVLKGTTA